MAKPKRAALDAFTTTKAPATVDEPVAPTVAPTGGKIRHISLRLEPDRWLRLREFSLHDGRSVQRIVVDLLDELLDARPKASRCERCAHRLDLHVERNGLLVCIVCDRTSPNLPCAEPSLRVLMLR